MKPNESSRSIGQFSCYPVGLGCMNLSHGYVPVDDKSAIELLNKALDMGYQMLDTAALYGYGSNERLIAKAVGHRRDEYLLASKCGIYRDSNRERIICSDPNTIRRICEESLSRLNTDAIDLYYLHRWDKTTPIEESIEALAQLKKEGKILEIGLSEVSASTLSRAHQVHPIAAVQSEYSLWTRNPEIALLDKCEELGVALITFSPLGRGMLTGQITPKTIFSEHDIRRNMPRFLSNNLVHNSQLIEELEQLVAPYMEHYNVAPLTLATVVLAWLLTRSENIHVIPGTTNLHHLKENFICPEIIISDHLYHQMDALINQHTVKGERYNSLAQQDIDTEEFN
ncbi:MAG: Aldo-keto reductase IolS [Candidatus Celerinatantimonas neptuna]|nr:MAG: Aldo-keto reductase IolS [Candidatus Celerinatantimonas neptuna]